MWRGLLLYGFWGSAAGGAAIDYFTLYLDWNTAAREYLNNFYGTTNLDLVPLLARFLQEGTAQDSTRQWKALNDGLRGL